MTTDRLKRIEACYNADYDRVPGGPDVTWAEMELAQELKELREKLKHHLGAKQRQLDQCQKQRDSLKVENAELEKRLWNAEEGTWPFEWQVATRLREKLKECREALAQCKRRKGNLTDFAADEMRKLESELDDYREALAAAEARERSYAKLAEKSVGVMREHGYVLDDLDDRWQKLVFTLQNMLVRIACDVSQADHTALDAYVEEWREEVVRLEIESEKRGLENRELERKLAECREALGGGGEG